MESEKEIKTTTKNICYNIWIDVFMDIYYGNTNYMFK